MPVLVILPTKIKHESTEAPYPKYVFKNFSKYVFVNTSIPISETVGDVTPIFARLIGPETSHTVHGGQILHSFILQMRNLSLEMFSLLKFQAPHSELTRAGRRILD